MSRESYVNFTENMADALCPDGDASDAVFVLESVMGYVFRGEPLARLDDRRLKTKRALFLQALLEDNPRGAVTDDER